jgi:integrase
MSVPAALLKEFILSLSGKAGTTVDAYQRELRNFVLRSLVERQEDARGEALFALGYWAGCRISDVAWLRIEHLHIGPKVGWVHVGYKGGKMRDIDLLNPVRRDPCIRTFRRQTGIKTAPLYLAHNAPRDSPRLASTIGSARSKHEPIKKNGV